MSAVKPVYRNHSMDHKIVALVDRWLDVIYDKNQCGTSSLVESTKSSLPLGVVRRR
jgi:hypothetical protein